MMGAFDKKKRIIRWKEKRERVCVLACVCIERYRECARVSVRVSDRWAETGFNLKQKFSHGEGF